MKKVFLNLLKQPITNSYLKKIDNKTTKKEFFYNLSVVFDSKNYLVSLLKPEIYLQVLILIKLNKKYSLNL